jgi:hypothetical protein
MIKYPVLEGRWLRPGDQNVIVLNHMLVSELEEQGVTCKVSGTTSRWTSTAGDRPGTWSELSWK